MSEPEAISVSAEFSRGAQRRLGRRRPVRAPSPLFWRIAATNAAVLIAACLIAALLPGSLERFAVYEVIVVIVTVAALGALNFFILRRAFAPLEQLTRFAHEVDLESPAQRVSLHGASSELLALAGAFNGMLERLDSEQREKTRRVLAAQEAERQRVAQELHDEVGQTLTALLLQLSQAAAHAPPQLRDDLTQTQEVARSSLEDIRRIAVELRPESLEDLGLASALVSLSRRLSRGGQLRLQRMIEADLPQLSNEQELVIYRIAQEALTNVVRHSSSATAIISLTGDSDGHVVLEVRDQGRGFAGASPGSGLRGMRERAALVGATLSIGQSVDGGVDVVLRVPHHAPARAT